MYAEALESVKPLLLDILAPAPETSDMSDPFFFGYGSLVNRTTHVYEDAHPAILQGWRRAWVHTASRDMAFLSILPAQGHSIAGLIARVPGNDWAALDERERGYARFDASGAVDHSAETQEIQAYAVPEHTHVNGGENLILLSYLDVAVQGFLTEFGESGVADFFATTDGWHTHILNDRAAPIYPRARTLSAQETALVDDHLSALSAVIKERE